MTRADASLGGANSFTQNLAFVIASVNHGVLPLVVLNDAHNGDFDRLVASLLHPVDCVVISPGPGRCVVKRPPNTKLKPNCRPPTGLSKSCLQKPQLPVLGVCLGMQTIAVEFGAHVVKAPRPMHGRLSLTTRERDCALLANVEFPLSVVRYHSLCVRVPADCELRVTMTAVDDACVMAIEHASRPVFGVQFHPESVGAGVGGPLIVRNFLRLVRFAVPSPLPPLALPVVERAAKRGTPTARVQCVKVHCPGVDREAVFAALFQSSPCCVWLDANRDAGGLMSIMAAGTERVECFVEPEYTRRTCRNVPLDACVVRCSDDAGVRECRGVDIFAYLAQRLADARMQPDPDCPARFVGGFVGVLGYGLRSLCTPSSATAQAAQPVWTAAQGEHVREPDASFVYCPRAVVFDHDQHNACVLSVLDDDAAWLDATAAALRALLASAVAAAPVEMPVATLPPPSPVLVPLLTGAAYAQRVEQCIAHLVEGESYEICLTTQVRVRLDASAAMDAWALYRAIRSSNRAPFSAYFPLGGGRALCCTSPERFISVKAGVVESRPIKGTRPRGASAESDAALAAELEASEKDRAENMMIVDLTRNDLSKVCRVGTVAVPQMMRVESYAVHQLVSAVVGSLDARHTAVDALRAAFPPPSMTGAPKLRTMELLDTLEDEPRGLYSGALGYLSLNGDADFNVVIRSAVVSGDTISVGAGGAVTVLSDPRGEYEEMLLKARTLGLRVCERAS